MQRLWDVVMYTILAAMVVLIVLNAKGVAGLLATGGNIWLGETSILTGGQYGKQVPTVKAA